MEAIAAVATGVLFAATHLGWTPTVLIVPVVLFGVGLCLLVACSTLAALTLARLIALALALGGGTDLEAVA